MHETIAGAYRKDVQTFLGLDQPLRPYINHRVGKGADYHYAIDICKPKYKRLRRELVEMGTNASAWIQRYFLPLDNVHVSSPDYFITRMKEWSRDPCEDQMSSKHL